MNRNARAAIAAHTLRVIDDATYTTELGTTVALQSAIAACDENTKVCVAAEWDALLELKPAHTRTQQISVTNEFSIACCRRLRAENADARIACLNFASAKNPCGGMKGGSLAQEESLGLCSALHSSLTTPAAQEHYARNRADPRGCRYHDSLVYSPQCVVFRDDADYSLLEDPIKVDFISCPSVNWGEAKKRGVPKEEADAIMRRRICAVLAIAAREDCDVLVLGSWGTGVFGYDTMDIAKMFGNQLTAPDARFKNAFSMVVFAVGKDDAKRRIFQSELLGDKEMR